MSRRRLGVIVQALVIAWLIAFGAQRASADTLVLVDVPGPIEDAVRTALAPWSVELVIVRPAPAAYEPRPLALERRAGFVVWRRGDDLLLYDAALASEERRTLPAESDDAGAVAMALSIQAWMGLESTTGCASDCAAPPPRWQVEVATGVRGAPSEQGGASFRYALSGGYRHRAYEAGVRVDLGLDRAGVAFGADGTWSRVGVGLWARLGVPLSRRVAILPGAGVGLMRVGFVAPRTGPGTQGADVSGTTVAVDAEVGARWQRGRLRAGLRLGLTLVPAAMTFKVRATELRLAAHVEPWGLATAGVAF